jgi:hypothetical protein
LSEWALLQSSSLSRPRRSTTRALPALLRSCVVSELFGCYKLNSKRFIFPFGEKGDIVQCFSQVLAYFRLKLIRRQSLVGGVSGGYGPGQEFCDAVDRVFDDVGQDVSKVTSWVDAVGLSVAELCVVDGGGAFSAAVGTGEEIVLFSERDNAQRSFGRAVVHLDGAVIEISRERVADCSGLVALGGLPRTCFSTA